MSEAPIVEIGPEVQTGLLAFFTALVSGGTIAKFLNRPNDKAKARETEVAVLRAIIDEVRESERRAVDRVGALESRVFRLEERERSILSSVAIHEGWDAVALATLRELDPDYPPPPSLITPRP